ncbi:MAG: class I SAM-dependent methyltransferase [Deltaproteobacteria bacterium]|nr:class I SAM-dependent methyltransferase [Deltaproteobacteria bacterium]
MNFLPEFGAEPSFACKLCGGLAKPLMGHNGFSIVRCGACGFMFALVPKEYDLGAVYADDAYWNGGCNYGYPDYEQAWRDARQLLLLRLKRLEHLTRPGRMLEIGCAAGYFLREAHRRGWQVCGVELSPTMRRRCEDLVGCRVFGSLQEATDSALRFDCVAMFEVIEHLDEPLRFMRQVRSVMTPRAILVLSTPNFIAPEAFGNPQSNHWFCPPAHVSYFTPDTLRDCVEQAGFEAIQIVGVLEGEEMPLPDALARALAPFRKGRRLRPGGLIGKLIKIWQRRRRDVLMWANSLELYARNPAG